MDTHPGDAASFPSTVMVLWSQLFASWGWTPAVNLNCGKLVSDISSILVSCTHQSDQVFRKRHLSTGSSVIFSMLIHQCQKHKLENNNYHQIIQVSLDVPLHLGVSKSFPILMPHSTAHSFASHPWSPWHYLSRTGKPWPIRKVYRKTQLQIDHFIAKFIGS